MVEDLPGSSLGGRSASTDPANWAVPADVPAQIGPFDKNLSGGQLRAGFMVGGEGWYRRTLSSDELPPAGRTQICFEGIFQRADIWLNGSHLGFFPFGYNPIYLELGPHLRRDGTDVLAVRVRTPGRVSRWYSGSGIYRGVWLTASAATSIQPDGIAVRSLSIAPTRATIEVAIETQSPPGALDLDSVTLEVTDSHGRVVGRAAAAPSSDGRHVMRLDIAQPALWSPASPALYTARARLRSKNAEIDSDAVTFGIRQVEMNAGGFRVNGRTYKLKGANVHSEHSVEGSASFAASERRRVAILKERGFNAIRTAHNPPSREFLDACDRAGIFVIHETFDVWKSDLNKSPDDYHLFFNEHWEKDLESVIRRDRNHPCIIMWSTGNEIFHSAETGRQIAQKIRSIDSTRAITQSAAMGEGVRLPTQFQGPEWDFLDVGDIHYQLVFDQLHPIHPDKAMAQTESFPAQIWENWQAVKTHDYVIGDFGWAGWDYFGEASAGSTLLLPHGAPDPALAAPLRLGYPWFGAVCGDLDLIGFPKPQWYYKTVVWGDSALEMAVERPVPPGMEQRAAYWSYYDELQSWTWDVAPGTNLRVRTYSAGDRVSLHLNGREIAAAPVTLADKCVKVFDIPYSPGELVAIAFRANREIGRRTFRTAGAPNRLNISAFEKIMPAGRDSICHLVVEVLDSHGGLVPDAIVDVGVNVEGAGQLMGMANANLKNMDSFRSKQRYTYHGRALAIVRSTGEGGAAKVIATAPGLAPAMAGIWFTKGSAG
jgi:beta-galactosidase